MKNLLLFSTIFSFALYANPAVQAGDNGCGCASVVVESSCGCGAVAETSCGCETASEVVEAASPEAETPPPPAPEAKTPPAPKAEAAAPEKVEAKKVEAAATPPNEEPLEEGFVRIFNGKDLTGWKPAEEGKWEVKDGLLVASGPRTHLYSDKEYKNFIFKADVKTTPGSNSGLYFHTKYLPTGWPTHGHESQVNVTHGDPVKTGSIYNVVRLFKTPAKDNEWWTQTIIVKDRRIKVLINDEQVLDYEEPEGVAGTRKISKGSFAIQAHDPKSTTYYKNIRVKELP